MGISSQTGRLLFKELIRKFLISPNKMSDAEVKNNVAAEAPTAEELKAQKRSAEDDDVDVKKQKTENGKYDEENGEDEEDAEEEEDIDGEEEEDLDGEGEDDLDKEDGGEDDEEGEEEEERVKRKRENKLLLLTKTQM